MLRVGLIYLTGTVTFTGANTTFVGIEDYGNGWYRCILSFTASCNNSCQFNFKVNGW